LNLFIILKKLLFEWVGTSIGTWGSLSLHFNHVNMKSQRGELGGIKSLVESAIVVVGT
jgi:hypothetical protein